MTNRQASEEITILETSEIALIPLVKSILDSTDIPYRTEGEVMMSLFPSSHLATVTSKPGAGLVRFLVPSEHAATARELLEPVEDPPTDD